MGELDRSTLFANEAFVIGMLQAVSGGAVIAALANYSTFKELTSRIPFLLFFTAALTTLALAVLAAYFRHQYKMWDVKAADSQGKQKDDEAKERWAKANCYLTAMRRILAVAVVVFLFGLAVPVVSVWAAELYKPVAPNKALNPDAPNSGAPGS